MRRTVLLVSELGEGMGHARRLLRIGRALRAAGFAPVAAMREPWVCTDAFRAAGIPVLQSPAHRACIPTGGLWIRSYADMAAACGFGDEASLWPTVLCWTALLDLVRPGVVVADYSPLATLACFERHPVVAVGDGFVLPPPQLARMPRFRTRGSEMAGEDALVAHAGAVMARLGRGPPSALPALVGGQAHAVCTFPELDIYRHLRTAPALGPVDAVGGPLPAPERPRLFLYLSGHNASTPRVVAAAGATGIPAEAYIRDLDAAAAAAMRSEGVTLHGAEQDMAEVLGRCSVLVHHGGIGTLERALAAGRPQLLVPAQLEQTLNAVNARAGGFGRMAGQADDVAALSAAMAERAASAEARAAAADLAAELGRRDGGAALRSIVEACDRLAA